jgi:GTP cyclohydrolase I
MNQDPEMIKQGATLILKGLCIDTSEPDFKDTPKRIANSLMKYIIPRSSLNEAEKHLGITFPSDYSGPITITNMRVKGMCPHHLLPIIYHANLTYIPKGGQVVGSSKPFLYLKELARLPIMQEELTLLFCNTFEKVVKPIGLSFELRGRFLCYENDGIHSDESEMITSIKTGSFDKDYSDRNIPTPHH